MDLIYDSDEEDYSFQYWNDWKPESNTQHLNPEVKKIKVSFNRNNGNDNQITVSSMEIDKKFGNWIPPVNFCAERRDIVLRKVALKRAQQKRDNEDFKIIDSWASDAFNESKLFDKSKLDLNESKLLESSFTQVGDSSMQKYSEPYDSISEHWEKVLNTDWGKRVELHNITGIRDTDKVWGVVNLGVFGCIKLYINKYGNVCSLAEGTIAKEGSSESTLISISDSEILRKMLQLSKAQWSSLTDILQQRKLTLKFDAKAFYDLPKMSELEKLWLFICKRRHFLPDLCMLVKFSGAIKSLRQLKIIPKVVVQDIRTIDGNELL